MKRYSRQYIMPEIGTKGQEKLLNSKVAVVGLGALGTVIANNLARAGIGHLVLIDRDFVELSNLQRQIIFTEQDVLDRIPKVAAAKRFLAQVNQEIELTEVIDDLNHQNIYNILDGVDLIIDATDNFEIRFLLNDFSHEQNIPWIYGAAIGTTGMMMPVIPNKTPCLRCVIEDLPSADGKPTCETAGVLSATTGIIGNYETVEGLKILLQSNYVKQGLISIDLWYNSYNNIDISRRSGCPTCELSDYEFLRGKGRSEITTMCGEGSVQIFPRIEMGLNLKKIKDTLAPLGEVRLTPFNLSFKTEGKELVLFKNGRAMVKNAESQQEAKAFYTRYIGY
ncbi:ThiF family adenylyltransferase [Natranaerobius trueperi]|uniref:Thiamine biosynthesis protein ThiF n=1 Tax=Natranaerobius trueperi TaxID=759412 RepID=A0A226C3E4_9FIRM|nr:ThiF family adenylyltransferase [Natranaerobius trueperi]OWZ84930.1 thiamine biosynthesis protein ThiF [Natranaerobius trueperi]